jgi:hypothetical protein
MHTCTSCRPDHSKQTRGITDDPPRYLPSNRPMRIDQDPRVPLLIISGFSSIQKAAYPGHQGFGRQGNSLTGLTAYYEAMGLSRLADLVGVLRVYFQSYPCMSHVSRRNIITWSEPRLSTRPEAAPRSDRVSFLETHSKHFRLRCSILAIR